MSLSNKTRRDFLRNLAYLTAGGGVAAMIPQMRMMGTALASTSALSGYKALVCVYLAGGNDSWNMLVPNDTSRFNIYSTSRGGVYGVNGNTTGLALGQPTGTQIPLQVITDGNDANSATNKYFLHPSFGGTTAQSGNDAIGGLYRAGRLAFVTNIGTLNRPITKAQYNTPSNRPPQLYSHSDQENQWHQGNTGASVVTGWGGLCGDSLRTSNSNQQLSPCISIAGSNRFETGLSTKAYQMRSSGLQTLSGVCNPSGCTGTSGQRDVALNQLLQDTYANDFASEYGATFQRGRALYELLATGLANTTLATTFPNTSIGNQLAQVAKMIKLSRAQNYAARQIYYVRMGGFDMHDNLMGNSTSAHAALLKQVSDAFVAFDKAMGASDVNAANNVTLFTASEFGRTLSSNGNGSDHAWGGVQMVMGGAVHGGKLYTNGSNLTSGFPDQTLNSSISFSRGQFIPGIGMEQYAATLAQWMGITVTELPGIFPNLNNFGTNNLGFV